MLFAVLSNLLVSMCRTKPSSTQLKPSLAGGRLSELGWHWRHSAPNSATSADRSSCLRRIGAAKSNQSVLRMRAICLWLHVGCRTKPFFLCEEVGSLEKIPLKLTLPSRAVFRFFIFVEPWKKLSVFCSSKETLTLTLGL